MSNEVTSISLSAIADQLQHWLDYHAREHAGREHLPDDMHIYHPPVWPTRGVIKAWIQTMRTAVAQPTAALPEIDDELRWILGRPNFACAGLAQCLRRMGHSVAHKAEHEQAAAIHWMLGLYLKHGSAGWRDAAERVLKEEHHG